MRTTLDTHDELFRRAERRAADEGETFRTIAENALRFYLAKRPPARPYRLVFDLMDGTR